MPPSDVGAGHEQTLHDQQQQHLISLQGAAHSRGAPVTTTTAQQEPQQVSTSHAGGGVAAPARVALARAVCGDVMLDDPI